MKKVFIAGLLLVGVYAFYYYSNTPEVSKTPIVVSVPLAESRPYCFAYKNTATEGAPYSVEEHMTLTRVRGEITGTKDGTQSGPDMTNGYTGTLKGKANAEGLIELVYSYTVEGADGKELELFTIQGEDLIQTRYPLVEGRYEGVTMLIPERTKALEEMVYTQEECK